MVFIRIFLAAAFVIVALSCSKTEIPHTENPAIPVTIADSFAYPIGKKESITQAKDSDEWYNALDFGEEDHLGEDWNKNTGGRYVVYCR